MDDKGQEGTRWDVSCRLLRWCSVMRGHAIRGDDVFVIGRHIIVCFLKGKPLNADQPGDRHAAVYRQSYRPWTSSICDQ